MTTLSRVLDVGKQRKESLWQLVSAISSPLGGSSAPRAKTLRALLVCLQHFGEKQLNFFLDGFAPNGALVEHPLYSAQYALDVTHNQLGYDLDVILRAYHHRTHRISPVSQAATLMRKRLAEADLAAQQALQPAYERGLITQQSIAVAYYQKSPSIRVIPYAPVALIGIPFSAAGVQRDYAALAHEVGHYVFWRRPKDNTSASSAKSWDMNYLDRARRSLGAEPSRQKELLVIDPWLEEIFADLYGCLVAGPAAGVAMLDMVRRLPGTRWFEDDGEHPPPALRPVAYLTCLRAMAERAEGDALAFISDALEKIEHEHADWLGAIPGWLTLQLRNGQTVSYARLAELIEEAVADFLAPTTKMLGDLLPQGDQVWPLWSAPPFDHLQPPTFGAESNSPSTLLDLSLREENGQFRVKLAGEPWTAGDTGLSNEEWEQARNGDSNARESLKERGWHPWWLAVLSAGFWTTEGPGAGNPQPTG